MPRSPTGSAATSLSHVTSGRSKLVSTGVKVACTIRSWASASAASSVRTPRSRTCSGKDPKAAASHTTPITVAAETGLPGLLLLAWLVGAALLLAFRRHPVATSTAARGSAFGLALVAIVVHCLFYNALLEDPLFWALLGARRRRRADASARAEPA